MDRIVKITSTSQGKDVDKELFSEELTSFDEDIYREIISTVLNDKQKRRLEQPQETYPRVESVIAIHWHPEFVPLDIIAKRIRSTFPNVKNELIIPTQHNVFMTFDGLTGAEIDCYSRGFNRKVQLLVHFEESKLESADVLKAMVAHTFKYRSSQLYEYLDTIVDPAFDDRLQKAAEKTNADDELVSFVRIQCKKLKKLLEKHYAITPPENIKNKLVRNYFDLLRNRVDDRLINHAQVFLKGVKKIVKREFSLEYFYETEEIIEEVRSLGGGIVVPHPEQFWPILLADYDVDGYEVWNPQSQEYTKFLVDVVKRQNKARPSHKRQLLVFMGDDTHMAEKAKEPRLQDPLKANREIGVQPAWDDLDISKSLNLANFNREKIIEEYKSRLL